MPLADSLASLYVRWRVRRGLDRLAVGGLGSVPPGPVVFAATHGSWWDGLLALLLAERMGRRVRLVVDAPTMQRLPWLRYLGMVGLDRSTPFHMLAGMRALRAALDAGDSVWIFPEGRMVAPWRRPLKLAPGTAHLARVTGASIVPVSTAWWLPASPGLAAAMWLGPPVAAEDLAARLEDGLERAESWLEHGEGALEPLWDGSRTPDRGIGARVLSWVTG